MYTRLFIIILVSIQFTIGAYSQEFDYHFDELSDAQSDLSDAIGEFEYHLSDRSLDANLKQLLTDTAFKPNNAYHNHSLGNALWDIDTALSYKFHHIAYQMQPNDYEIAYDYALELHRRQEFDKAIAIYTVCLAMNTDYDIYAPLADCYINIGNTQKAKECWSKSNYDVRERDIVGLIHKIYGDASQTRRRDHLLNKLRTGDKTAAVDLIIMDVQWEGYKWRTKVKSDFLQHDIEVVTKLLGKDDKTCRLLQVYAEIMDHTERYLSSDSIEILLKANNIILNGGYIPKQGVIARDLLEACISVNNTLIESEDFFAKRGNELLSVAIANKSAELLYQYIYLQDSDDDKAKLELARIGWKEFGSHFFAWYYLDQKYQILLFSEGESLQPDDAELLQAMQQFPNSARLQWLQMHYAVNNKVEYKDYLIKLIKLEFKALNSDIQISADPLNDYFDGL